MKQEFNAEGELIRKVGTEGARNGQLDTPSALAIDSEDNVWVADAANNRVQKFNAEGEYLTQFGTPGNNNGQLSEPQGIATDAEASPGSPTPATTGCRAGC